MGMPAARVGDFHMCPMVDPGPKPHVGGPINPPGAITVQIGGQPAARMSDMATCVGPPDSITKGAFPVPISNLPAARMTDNCAHGGIIMIGCPTVLIGLAGTAGNVAAGTAACNAAANGRTSGATSQSTNNCGLESARQVVNSATGGNLTEQQMLNYATSTPMPGSPAASGNLATPNGGTWPVTQSQTMTNLGVPSSNGAWSRDAAGLAMSGGRGTLVNVDAGSLWPTTHGINPGSGAWHVVTVTGMEYDASGNVTNYIINDTGPSGAGVVNCGIRVPAATFEAAVGAYHTPSAGLVTTNNQVW
jgi:uncharacterized Zn-binding protein involved in type VI secretion